MKKDVVGPMLLPGGAVVFVQNLEFCIVSPHVYPSTNAAMFKIWNRSVQWFSTDAILHRQTDRQTDNFTFLYICKKIFVKR